MRMPIHVVATDDAVTLTLIAAALIVKRNHGPSAASASAPAVTAS
jgi:hypothetical protein